MPLSQERKKDPTVIPIVKTRKEEWRKRKKKKKEEIMRKALEGILKTLTLRTTGLSPLFTLFHIHQ